MSPVAFETSVVARADGELVIALMSRLGPPFERERTCVVLLKCSIEAATALCEGVGSAVASSNGPGVDDA
jgi:hypothetical protein